MDSIDRFFECNAPGVIFERFEDETVVINLDSGNYYTLDAMAAALWERLNESVALGGLIAETQRDYAGDPAEIEQAVREFVGVLLSEQLVRPVVAPPPAERGSRAEADRNGAPGKPTHLWNCHDHRLSRSRPLRRRDNFQPYALDSDIDLRGQDECAATGNDPREGDTPGHQLRRQASTR